MGSTDHGSVDVYLGLGSNQDPARHLLSGISALAGTFGEVSVSPFYRSAAVGFSGSDFLNGVARIHTDWSVGQLKAWLTELENRHGRDRSQPKFSDRSLDIDILLHGEQTGMVDGLELPRDEILKFAHVLQPMADLAPELVHPVSGRSFAEHWASFEGDRNLSRIDENG
ncbi:2-amino-4-hydroxy-6-hydroxymethyldihydropteridine diphosphokinase [Wenzhouxiangella marina]|uniref:2-amino-4-hydroxy-6-hydroxymethyldihydropteridine pyrophosphokinase n=1 Tax=Wenzhouxiangella marina TaxID=1579979 RepID=A0A0K0XSQ6_9GAMM|nr:2-amino-4-hydroxy-6-hydroxymethyldihydropteridine diphosphokinase [Wenzhouxiangella marina]AKS40667.1 2-amino-4-hydroxy-6-hydroxymethyldihydropteridine pyrophosphokinase [Wenzhouxiangella marina]MBB6088437.1 2-amino-4-hydroxy-6-hydroxymethyldihydropteridine diphosphokinase [Wenzhouxiangella marina]